MRLHIEAGEIKDIPLTGNILIKGFLINSGTEPAVLTITDPNGDITPVDGFINAVGDYTSGIADFNEEAVSTVTIALQGTGSKATIYYAQAQVQVVT